MRFWVFPKKDSFQNFTFFQPFFSIGNSKTKIIFCIINLVLWQVYRVSKILGCVCVEKIEIIEKLLHETTNQYSSIGNSIKDFQILKELGRGSFGVVFLVKPLSVGNVENLVMKKISIRQMNIKQQRSAVREVQILRKLRHPHIIKFFTSFLEYDNLYILMEYAEKGDLNSLIAS